MRDLFLTMPSQRRQERSNVIRRGSAADRRRAIRGAAVRLLVDRNHGALTSEQR